MKCSPLFEIRETQSTGQAAKEINQAQQQKENIAYPSLYATPGESPSTTTLPHHLRQPNMSNQNFDSAESTFGYNQNNQLNGTSPSFGSSEDGLSRSQSNHPTPSGSSNRTSSYSGLTPPQNFNHNFPTTTSAQNTQYPSTAGHTILPGMLPEWNPTDLNMDAAKQNINTPENPDLAFIVPEMTPGTTGMTPLPDSLWNNPNMSEGNDWMFNWNGQA